VLRNTPLNIVGHPNVKCGLSFIGYDIDKVIEQHVLKIAFFRFLNRRFAPLVEMTKESQTSFRTEYNEREKSQFLDFSIAASRLLSK